MKTDEFDYFLPTDRIAQHPATPREGAKLMVVDRKTTRIIHAHVSDMPMYLTPQDLLVVNNSKVFKARLRAHMESGTAELFLIRPLGAYWIALGKPGKKLTPGKSFEVAPGFGGAVVDRTVDGKLLVDFGISPADVMNAADIYGETPVPPYIKEDTDVSVYQTAYAKHVGSVAAPTAGFHLTPRLLKTLEQKGVEKKEITLHVGLGTFQPIRSQTITDHTMHPEWIDIRKEEATAIVQAKKNNKRIVAVGTTTVRTLEGVANLNNGVIAPYTGDINLFITPGFHFHVIDALLTNFHLPKSTLLVLVSAFAGTELIREAYRQAIEHDYRFYSFGDAMLIR